MFALLLVLSLTPAGPAEAGAEPLATVEAFHRALAAGDREAVLATLDSEVLIFEAGGAERSREEYASHHLAGDLEFAKAVERKVSERRQGGSGEFAWVLTRSETTGRFRDKDVATRDTETMLLRKAGPSWRIVHIHWSSRPVKK